MDDYLGTSEKKETKNKVSAYKQSKNIVSWKFSLCETTCWKKRLAALGEPEERIRRSSKNMWSVRSCICTRKQSLAEELQSASEMGGACPAFDAVGIMEPQCKLRAFYWQGKKKPAGVCL